MNYYSLIAILYFFNAISYEYCFADSVHPMSYNIKSGTGMDGVFNLQRTADVINQISPDFVGLQEVDNCTERAPIDEANTLAGLTGMYAFFGKMRDYEGGGYGIAILTKEEPTETRIFYYHKPGVVNQTRNCTGDAQGADYCQGAIAVLVPYVNGELTWFVTTHIGLYDQELDEVTELVTEFIPTLSAAGNVIITGDFNSDPSTDAIQYMVESGFTDLWPSCGDGGEGYTFNSEDPYERIDYIFVKTDEPLCSEMTVTDTEASDHCPVDAVLTY